MDRYPELTRARGDMRAQNELYQPTVFWDEASSRIVKEIQEHGVESFRSLPEPLGFFVPTYGSPGGGFTAEQTDALLGCLRREFPSDKKCELSLTLFLTGEMAARADYRALIAADEPSAKPYLHRFSESSAGAPIEQFEFDDRKFSRSALNYLLGLALLKKHLDGDMPRTVLEIGGGFGTLGEVLAASGVDDMRYIDVDIPPTSFVAQYYLSTALGSDRVATYDQTRDQKSIAISSLPPTSVLCSWQIERLTGTIDLFVNFISFQEMEPHIVANYLGHVSRLGARWVLLRNLREGKQVRNNDWVGVNKPILGDDYLAMLPDYDLVERNVLPFGYRTVDNFHSELLLLRRKTCRE